jgi:hypothetical protein
MQLFFHVLAKDLTRTSDKPHLQVKKGKAVPVHAMKAYRFEVQHFSFLT